MRKWDIREIIWAIMGLLLFFYIGVCWLAKPLKRYVEGFEGYLMEPNPIPIIPLDIYQTWHTKDLPPKMHECVETLKKQNPEFMHHLYDEEECYQFIKDNFDPEVAEAYDALIPKSYKSDLWRFCILYKRGGIYLDIKYYGVNGFKLINLTDKEHFVYDSTCYTVDGEKVDGIYTAIIVCLPGNIKLKKSIDLIVENVRTKYYGKSHLEPTGPLLLSKPFSEEEFNIIKSPKQPGEIKIDGFRNDVNKICIDGIPALIQYKEYYTKDNVVSNYMDLWNKRKVYK
jgi:hypothetical protein